MSVALLTDQESGLAKLSSHQSSPVHNRPGYPDREADTGQQMWSSQCLNPELYIILLSLWVESCLEGGMEGCLVEMVEMHSGF